MNDPEDFSTFLVDDDDDVSMLIADDLLKTPAHQDTAKLGRSHSSSTWQNSTPADSPSPFSGTTSSESANSPHSPNFSTPFSPQLSFSGLDAAPTWPSKMDTITPEILASDSPLANWDQWNSLGGMGTVSPSELLMKPGQLHAFQPRSPASPEYFESSMQSGSSVAPSIGSPQNPHLELPNTYNAFSGQQAFPLSDQALLSLNFGQHLGADLSSNIQVPTQSAEWFARRQMLQSIAFGVGLNGVGGRSDQSGSQDTSPEPEQKSGRRKRKSVAGPEGMADPNEEGKPPPKKTAHNMIEKRYRTNLNDKIAALRDSVPSLRVATKGAPEIAEGDDAQEDLDGLTPAHKLNKATVMAKATEYIKHLEKRGKSLNDENDVLKARLEAFEQLVKMGSPEFAGSLPTAEPDFMSTNTFQPPANMSLQVPEISRRSSTARPQASPVSRTARSSENRKSDKKSGTGVMGKLVVGSLGGLMMVQGFREHDGGSSHSGRGLFAVPVQALRWIANGLGSSHVSIHLGSSTAHLDLLSLFRVFLILGAALFIISSLLSDSKPDDEKEGYEAAQAPIVSTISPLENRRKAWLTAIQTVWVPQYSLVSNTAAITSKTVKLCLRKLLGWRLYCLLSRSTDDQEAARIKAWDIALDAQLAGGDSEINTSRLFLTFLASFTIPQTSGRLMLRALHIRVLHWRLTNLSNGMWILQDIVDKAARYYWNRARAVHDEAVIRPGEKGSSLDSQDLLPEHLVTLLQIEYEDVFLENLVQRAYNLSWNRQTAEDLDSTDPRLDAVVDDTAVRSSLDALAAWWSCLALNKACSQVLSAGGSTITSDIQSDIDIAETAAPPNSGAQHRAHVAKIAFGTNDGQTSLEHLRVLLEDLEGVSQPPTPSPQEAGMEQRTLNLLNAVTLALGGDSDLNVAARCASALAFARASPRSPARQAIAQRLFNSLSQHRYFKLCSSNNSRAVEAAARDIGQLGFTTAWKALEVFANDEELARGCTDGLEKVAGGLRIWIGGDMGRKCGLDRKDRSWVVETCLKVSKRVIGIKEAEDEDLGYETQSEGKEEVLA